jgi:hypothetical protein
MAGKLPPLLTVKEQANVRAALCYLRARLGTWAMVAKAVRSKRANLRRVLAGQRINGMRSLAGRIASAVGVPAQAVVTGAYPPPGTCPQCGRTPEKGTLDVHLVVVEHWPLLGDYVGGV